MEFIKKYFVNISSTEFLAHWFSKGFRVGIPLFSRIYFVPHPHMDKSLIYQIFNENQIQYFQWIK